MFEHIERLRKKSDAEKLRVVLGMSLGVTLVIGVFWGVAVAFRIESGTMSFKVSASESAGLKDIGSKLGGSWEAFFPKSESATATSEVIGTDAAVSAGAVPEMSPELQVILGRPESVEPEPVDAGSAYPADVY